MPYTPIERKAAFVAACTLKSAHKSKVALDEFGVSWTHLDAVLLGTRDGSEELRDKVAEYVGVPSKEFWKERLAASA